MFCSAPAYYRKLLAQLPGRQYPHQVGEVAVRAEYYGARILDSRLPERRYVRKVALQGSVAPLAELFQLGLALLDDHELGLPLLKALDDAFAQPRVAAEHYVASEAAALDAVYLGSYVQLGQGVYHYRDNEAYHDDLHHPVEQLDRGNLVESQPELREGGYYSEAVALVVHVKEEESV